MQTLSIKKSDPFTPIFTLDGKSLAVKPGNSIGDHELPPIIPLPELKPGSDYEIVFLEGRLVAALLLEARPSVSAIGGFHVGLDGEIARHSLWDAKFRPVAPDPRGMVLVGNFWADIYLLNVDPQIHGTSSASKEIADGTSEVMLPHGSRAPLTWWNAVAVLAAHGKQLLSLSEFSIAAQGVEEGKNNGTDPKTTGHIPGLRSAVGIEQATGCMWTWGRDLDPRGGWMVVLGGVWGSGASGPRQFVSGVPDGGWGDVAARGRCDHLILG